MPAPAPSKSKVDQELDAEILARTQLAREIVLTGKPYHKEWVDSLKFSCEQLSQWSNSAGYKNDPGKLKELKANFDKRYEIASEPDLQQLINDRKEKNNKLSQHPLSPAGKKLLKDIEEKIIAIEGKMSEPNRKQKLAVLRAQREYLIGTKDKAYVEGVVRDNEGYDKARFYSSVKRLCQQVERIKEGPEAVLAKNRNRKQAPELGEDRSRFSFKSRGSTNNG